MVALLPKYPILTVQGQLLALACTPLIIRNSCILGCTLGWPHLDCELVVDVVFVLVMMVVFVPGRFVVGRNREEKKSLKLKKLNRFFRA